MWSCEDSKKGFEVAVKVAKRNQSSTEQARDEVELLKCVGEAGNGVGSDSVMKMMGNFEQRWKQEFTVFYDTKPGSRKKFSCI